MGSENSQRHRFCCLGCSEEIEVGLDIDRQKLGWRVVLGHNAVQIEQDDTASIVNLHASFVFPLEMRGDALAFPSLEFGPAILTARMKAREAAGLPADPGPLTMDAALRPRFAGEWQALRMAWSLTRNGQSTLAATKIEEASRSLYPSDPPTLLNDWIFRFISQLVLPAVNRQFRNLADAMRPAVQSPGFADFARYYNQQMSEERGTRYFEIMRSYLASYDEFAQVQDLITSGLPIREDYYASSSDFDKTRMFYGDAFETFASQVDLLAFLNNLSAGRPFDTFATMSIDDYRLLDRGSRFRPFSSNAGFAGVCQEADNQVRNASHHGGFVFNRAQQEIVYRHGKGGTGPKKRMTYTQYLVRCVTIFMQTMLVFGADLVLANEAGMRPPL
jgi:hypothetical protein